MMEQQDLFSTAAVPPKAPEAPPVTPSRRRSRRAPVVYPNGERAAASGATKKEVSLRVRGKDVPIGHAIRVNSPGAEGQDELKPYRWVAYFTNPYTNRTVLIKGPFASATAATRGVYARGLKVERQHRRKHTR